MEDADVGEARPENVTSEAVQPWCATRRRSSSAIGMTWPAKGLAMRMTCDGDGRGDDGGSRGIWGFFWCPGLYCSAKGIFANELSTLGRREREGKKSAPVPPAVACGRALPRRHLHPARRAPPPSVPCIATACTSPPCTAAGSPVPLRHLRPCCALPPPAPGPPCAAAGRAVRPMFLTACATACSNRGTTPLLL
ncbi:hypothetical protein DAI22_02g345333 [Oryza sativa Japonica Group]|nr:hypothetical protein DAI22_02g345333 [Oryza sativa Japonica Group]